jgi:hypothetical protein
MEARIMDLLHRSNYMQNGHSIIPLNGFYRAQESCRSDAYAILQSNIDS